MRERHGSALLTWRRRDGRHWQPSFASVPVDGEVWIPQQPLHAGAIGWTGARETWSASAVTQASAQARGACRRSRFDSALKQVHHESSRIVTFATATNTTR